MFIRTCKRKFKQPHIGCNFEKKKCNCLALWSGFLLSFDLCMMDKLPEKVKYKIPNSYAIFYEKVDPNIMDDVRTNEPRA